MGSIAYRQFILGSYQAGLRQRMGIIQAQTGLHPVWLHHKLHAFSLPGERMVVPGASPGSPRRVAWKLGQLQTHLCSSPYLLSSLLLFVPFPSLFLCPYNTVGLTLLANP